MALTSARCLRRFTIFFMSVNSSIKEVRCMDRLNPWIVGLAATAVFLFLSIVCALAVVLFPDGIVGFFNGWFHGLNLTLVKPPGGRPSTLGQFLYWLFGVAVTSFLVGAM